MTKQIKLKPNNTKINLINFGNIVIKEITVLPLKVQREIIVNLEILDAKDYNSLKYLNNYISDGLNEFKNYIIRYKCNFLDGNFNDITKFLLEKFLLENSFYVSFLKNYTYQSSINSLDIILNDEFNYNFLKNQKFNILLERELKKYISDINVNLYLQEVKKTKKQIKEEVKKQEVNVYIMDLEIGKSLDITAEVFYIEEKKIRTKAGENKKIISFYVTDYKKSLICRKFYNEEDKIDISVNDIVKVKGIFQKNEMYKTEYYLNVKSIEKIDVVSHEIIDNAEEKRVELSLKTNMSEMTSNINCKKITDIMRNIGYSAFAVTDLGVLHSFPFIYKNYDDIKVIFGMEAYIVDDEANLVVNPKNVIIEDEIYVIFDIETTGFDPYSDKIIEIGAIKVKNGEIIDRFSEFINPQIKIPEKITELTSITDEDVKDADIIDIILPKFIKFIDDCTLVAHNAKFDVGFVREKASILGIKTNFSYIDTIQWAKLVLKDQKRFSLDALCKRFELVNEFHHRAINDAEVTSKIFLILLRLVSNLGVNTLKDINDKLQLDIKRAPVLKTTILVKNKAGLKKLYELVSDSLIYSFGNSRPRIKKSILEKSRENFLISSAPTADYENSGELISMYLRAMDKEEIIEKAKFYDYIQIMPVDSYNRNVEDNTIPDKNYIIEMNKYFFNLGKTLNIPVVAVGNVMYLNKEEAKAKSVLQLINQEIKASKVDSFDHFRTTDDMQKEFEYLGKENSKLVVVENTNKIADMIEKIKPIPDGFYPPKIDGDVEMVKELTYSKAKELYGENIHPIIKERIEKELNSIIGNGFAVLYLIAQKLVKKSLENGYLVGSRGSVGSSIVAYLMGITEVNGLAPHYLCSNCKNIEIFDKEISGVDLEEKNCPNCGNLYKRDGHAIPFEVFMGFNGDKVPDIDLNFSGEFQSEIHKYTEELFGKDKVFRAGTISTTAESNAIGYVKKFFELKLDQSVKQELIKNFGSLDDSLEQAKFKEIYISNEMIKNRAEIIRLAKMIEGTRKTTGQHPGGMVVIPSNMSVYDFTPVQKPANDLKSESTTTHFDYHVMDEQLVKLDILGHDDPTTLKILQDLTGISLYDIPLNDKKVLSLFTSTDALNVNSNDIMCELGTNGIPEFGTNFVKEMLRDTKPTTFTELVKISGLSHGTDVWLNNAKDYINSNVATLNEVITVRDDIMNYLILQGIDKNTAFKIMEFVRKGLPSKKKDQWQEYKDILKKNNIKDWYIESCEKIKYMFPKGHAVAYVMMAIRIAYFKVYYPLEFYTAYLNRKVSSFAISKMKKPVEQLKIRLNELNQIANKNVLEKAEITLLEILVEMHYRGIELLNVDLDKSEAKTFIIENGKIRIPFIAVDQLGEVVANNIVEQRNNSKFTSIENFVNRTGINSTVLKTLRNSGVLNQLNETDQQTLF